MTELDGIVTFVRVVEQSGISAAARVMGVPKSTVSRELGRLERRLGVRLMHRNTRTITLTEAGAEYHVRCAAIVAAADAAREAVRDDALAPRGLLRVTASVGFGTRYLAPIVAAFLAEHPDVRMELKLLDRRVNLVEEGFDVAVRMGSLDDSSLVARRLGVVDRVLCAAPAYVARAGVPDAPEQLRKHVCLTLDPDHRHWTLGGRTVVVGWQLACNHVEVLRTATLAGLGLSLLPRFLVQDDIVQGRLVEVLAQAPSEPAIFHALYAATSPLPALTGRFVARLLEGFRTVA